MALTQGVCVCAFVCVCSRAGTHAEIVRIRTRVALAIVGEMDTSPERSPVLSLSPQSHALFRSGGKVGSKTVFFEGKLSKKTVDFSFSVTGRGGTEGEVKGKSLCRLYR